jgi:hypothetical protein
MPIRFVTLLLLAFMSPTAPTWAADLADADRTAIRSVIENQLAAFQQDDGTTAFSYAAPPIKQKFGNPATFMRMVRSGYAPVYRPRSVEFADMTEIAGSPAQRVVVVGPDGFTYLAVYIMERQLDGRWLIGGCILRRLEETSV